MLILQSATVTSHRSFSAHFSLVAYAAGRAFPDAYACDIEKKRWYMLKRKSPLFSADGPVKASCGCNEHNVAPPLSSVSSLA